MDFQYYLEVVHVIWFCNICSPAYIAPHFSGSVHKNSWHLLATWTTNSPTENTSNLPSCAS